MRREIEEVFEKVREFRATIAGILERAGLVEKELTEDDDDDMGLDSDASGSKRVTEAELEAQRLER
jgi:hypothetical protein